MSATPPPGIPASVQTPFVSVIMPTFMRYEASERAIRSVLANDYPPERFELIVVDGNSSDGTPAMIEQIHREFPGRLLYLRKPPEGQSASRNFGAARARGEILAFIDSDCEADPGWLRSAVSRFADRPRLGIVQGRTLPPPGVSLRPRSRYLLIEEANWVYDGCNILYRREAFEQVGGFSDQHYVDPRSLSPETNPVRRFLPFLSHVSFVMKLSGEDTDLGWRVLERGWEADFCATAVVYHEVVILPPFRWMVSEGLYTFGLPRLVRRHPGIRSFLTGRYFLDEAHRRLTILILGVLGAVFVNGWLALLALPYVFHRGWADQSRFWRGPLKPIRALVQLPRDLITFGFLLAGSIRSGAVVL